MKDYRDLTISGTRERLVATLAEIEKAMNDGWKRNKQIEEEFRAPAGLTTGQTAFCFTCTATTCRKAAHLLLLNNADGALRLTNIVPHEYGQLTHDEFNYILEEFLKKFVRPAADKTAVTVETSSGVVTIDDWFSAETAEKLRHFLKLTHGSTSRPDDYELWMAFLVSAHREGAKVHGDRFRRWLEEDARCGEFRAERLASDYQRSQDLLSFEEHYQGA